MNNINKLKTFVPIAIFGLISVIVINFSDFDVFNNFGPKVNEARNLYKQAKNYQDNNDFKSAYYTYGKISSGYLAHDIVLFQQAKCAAQLEDEKTTINKLETILTRHKGSPIKALASYNLGQAYVRTNEYAKAERQFLRIIKNYPDTDFAIGSNYYLGQINKNKEIKAQYWLKYISLAPDGRFALDCIDGITSLKINLTTNDKKTLGIALFKNKKYHEAHKYLRQVPIKDSWYYLAKTNSYLGNHKMARYFIKEGIWKYHNNVEQEQLNDAMTYYVRYNPQPAIKSWSELTNIKRSGDFILFNKAKLLPNSYTFQFYSAIVNNYPNGNYASEALWNLFWNEFNKGNYNQAIQFGKKHENTYVNTKASPKILFWTAKSYERTGQKTLAKEYYNNVLTKYPDSYYAFRANGRLKALNYGKDPAWNTNIHSSIDEQDSKYLGHYSYADINKQYGGQIAELSSIGDYETILSIIKYDPFLDSWIKSQNGLTSKSIVLARDGMNKLMPKPDSQDKRWKLIYPVFYSEDINHFASINNLDPILMLSLLKEESYFNPFAVSSSNAQGLMQILPGTAKDVARWNNFGQINRFYLFNPKNNIKIGTAYFRYAKSRLNNSDLYAVAGYNGGPGSVEKWLRNIPSKDLDQFIENIPYDQTRDYIKKVYGSYWNYKRIYNY